MPWKQIITEGFQSGKQEYGMGIGLQANRMGGVRINTIQYDTFFIFNFISANLQTSSALGTYFIFITLLSPQNTGKFPIIQAIKVLYILSLSKFFLWKGQNITN